MLDAFFFKISNEVEFTCKRKFSTAMSDYEFKLEI